MAHAATPYETRVARLLLDADGDPLTVGEVGARLAARWGIKNVDAAKIRTALHSNTAYALVDDEKWVLANKRRRAPPKEAGPGRAAAFFGGVPPLEVLPDGEFAGGALAVGGGLADKKEIARAAEALARKGAGRVYCLRAHPAGAAMLALLAAWPGPPLMEGVGVGGEEKPRTRRAAAAERLEAAAEGDKGLCLLLSPEGALAEESLQLLATFEAKKAAAYLW